MKIIFLIQFFNSWSGRDWLNNQTICKNIVQSRIEKFDSESVYILLKVHVEVILNKNLI